MAGGIKIIVRERHGRRESAKRERKKLGEDLNEKESERWSHEWHFFFESFTRQPQPSCENLECYPLDQSFKKAWLGMASDNH